MNYINPDNKFKSGERVIVNKNFYGSWVYGNIHAYFPKEDEYDVSIEKNNIIYSVKGEMLRRVFFFVGDIVNVKDVIPDVFENANSPNKIIPIMRQAKILKRWANNYSYDLEFLDGKNEIRIGVNVNFIYASKPFDITDVPICPMDTSNTTVTTGDVSDPVFGQRVIANFKEMGVWKYGYICNVNSDNKYSVTYDLCGGNIQPFTETLRKEMIQPIQFSVGDKVKVNYKNTRQLREAMITFVWGNRLQYNVQYILPQHSEEPTQEDSELDEYGYGVHCRFIRFTDSHFPPTQICHDHDIDFQR